MPFITQGKTNFKYILIIVILAVIVGGGIFYQWWALKEEIKIPEMKTPEKVTENEAEVKPEKELEESRVTDPISNVEIIARENKLDKDKTDIFIKDLEANEEEFYITLSDVWESYYHFAEFRNEHLYIVIRKSKGEYGAFEESQLWKYTSPEDNGSILFQSKIYGEGDFRVSPDETYIVKRANYSLYFGLLFINLTTGEQKKLSGEDLLTQVAISKVPSGYLPWLNLDEWSPDSAGFSGFFIIPEFSDRELSSFEITVKGWGIEKFDNPDFPIPPNRF